MDKVTHRERVTKSITTENANSADLTIFNRKNPFDYVWYLLLVIITALFYEGVVDNSRWQWKTVAEYMFSARVIEGLCNTLILALCASVLGLVLGVIIAACRMSTNRALRGIAYVYIWFIRAIPTLAMLLFLFFISALIPKLHLWVPFTDVELFSISTNHLISRFSAAMIGLAIYLGGHSAEIFRSGITAVEKGQREACKAMGMSDFYMMWHVVVPQAIRVIIPPLANELITMFKNTSLASVIGYIELLTTVQLIYSNNFETIPLLTVACIWYLIVTSVAMIGQAFLEYRFKRGS